jgi:IS30 family transposase
VQKPKIKTKVVRKVSKQVLADVLGVHRNTITRMIERGEIGGTEIEHILEYGKELGRREQLANMKPMLEEGFSLFIEHMGMRKV